MIYVSHLISDEEIKEFTTEYKTGIECIDFSISEKLDELEKSITDYQKRAATLEIEHLILHGPYIDINPCAYDRLVREATMTRFGQCYEAGLALGADKIVFHSGMNPYVYYKEYWAEHVAKFWREFLKERQEMEVVLENVFDDDWKLMLDVYKMVDCPNFKLCLDIGHAHCYSSLDVREWAKNLAPYVSHVHIHDNCGDRDAHIGLGEGNLPWKEVLDCLPQTENRTWTIECMKKKDIEISIKKY